MSVDPHDLSAFPRPSLAVDLVLLTVADGRLKALTLRRADAPAAGAWALPGGFVHIDETIEMAVARVLRDKARITQAFVEQLYTFGALDRDPRGRVVSVAHYALVAAEVLEDAEARTDDLRLRDVVTPWRGEAGGPAFLGGAGGGPEPLPFDHGDILGLAVKRLRGKLDYTDVGLALLPQRFTLRDLQSVHEAILGHPLTKPAFRRKVLDRGYLEPTGERETASAFRPAELYRRAVPQDRS